MRTEVLQYYIWVCVSNTISIINFTVHETEYDCGQKAPTKVNASDDRGDEVKNLKRLNQTLLITITNERKQIDELKNTLQLSDAASKELLVEINKDKSQWDSYEEAMKNTIEELKNELTETRVMSESNEKLCTQLTQKKNELENKLKELENKFKECNEEIKELQYLKNELNQTSILSENQEKLCTQLPQEKYELENKLKECNDEIQRLQVVKNELNQTRILGRYAHRNCKNELRKCNEGAKKLKVKMVEDQKFWDSSRVRLEGKITEQQNEIDEARKLSKKHEELYTQLMQEKIKMEKDLQKVIDVLRN
ncbi:uncharacterized protein LOC131858251 [Cryptomeria japonica]|uniref:uncharacterized protein LOC131858251 n=1 Tax=Cryptomeria japonica TaxID=3369 RepID=UPI0027DA7EB3|nr:uncharacterized protein LOC131858251 [Cryptomeria japonica]